MRQPTLHRERPRRAPCASSSRLPLDAVLQLPPHLVWRTPASGASLPLSAASASTAFAGNLLAFILFVSPIPNLEENY